MRARASAAATRLKLHGDGSGWIGMGWNLFGWYPENAGIDLTPYSHLTFQIRVEAKSEGPVLDPGAVAVLLGCSRNKNDSATVPVERYVKGFTDGKWHKVYIPISAFVKGGGAKFDLSSFWEFRIGTWSATPRTSTSTSTISRREAVTIAPGHGHVNPTLSPGSS